MTRNYSIRPGLIILIISLISVFSFAQDYPFTLPDTIVATLDVKTSETEVFKNPILGYNIFGFNTASEKEFINTFNPTTIRFPHGLYANWYDWRTDQTRLFGEETFDYIHTDGSTKKTEIDQLAAINTFDRLNVKVGIDGLEQLNKAHKGGGYDVVWTFNMSVDGPDFNNGSPESVAHYEDLIARGFAVKIIEMGNECFYPGQRSSIIPNDTEYMARARSMYAAIKAKDSTVQLSVPLLRRSSWANAKWNERLTKDMDYFDAVTVHTYIGHDPDNADNSDDAYSTALTARKSLASSTNDFVRVYSKDKPIWLTEWGVKSGGPNGASVLGMADCYLFMAENQDIYHRANWFSVNGKLNSFVVWEDYISNGNTKQRIKYPLEKTGYGAGHEILKAIFENSTLLESAVTTQELVSGVKAINARAVTKDGVTSVFAVNLTDKPTVFAINIDGEPLENSYLHEALEYQSVGQEKVFAIDQSPLKIVKEGQGEIILPPLSLNKITIKEVPMPEEYTVHFTSPQEGIVLEEGVDLVVEAEAGASVSSVSLYLNDSLVRSISEGAYQWGIDTLVDVALSNMSTGFYTLKLVAENADTISYEDSITVAIEIADGQFPYDGIITIPGKFEAEDYDLGGEGVAYHDSDDNNQSGVYRTDAVDIGSAGSGFVVAYSNNSEWLEYTVEVVETAEYSLDINYASGRPGGGAKIAVSLPDEGVELVPAYDLAVTGVWSDYTTLNLGSVLLTKGRHVIRLTVAERGYNLDWIELKLKDETLVTKLQTKKIDIYPNPSADGYFQLSTDCEWQVYTLSGMKAKQGKGRYIDISQNMRGVYVVLVDNKPYKIVY